MNTAADRFEMFEHHVVDTGEASIHVWKAGQGEPLLLVHGYPQDHMMWHRVAPALTDRFTVIVPDLRGYGDSECPPSVPDHSSYSKRAMAHDQVKVMEHFGFSSFFVMGHDRGARVSHQMTLDFPDRVRRLILLDIVSTLDMYEQMDFDRSHRYYHWFFLDQAAPLPELLIAGDSDAFVRSFLTRLSEEADVFPPDVIAHYVEKFSKTSVIHATCEDYRAGSTCDLEHQREETARFRTPTLVLWGAPGLRQLDVLGLWRSRGEFISGAVVEGVGHYIPEEAPEVTAEAARVFFSETEPTLGDEGLARILSA